MALEETVATAAEEFAVKVAGLSEEVYLREGLIKMAVRELTWALYEKFKDVDHTLPRNLKSWPKRCRSRLSRTTRRPERQHNSMWK